MAKYEVRIDIFSKENNEDLGSSGLFVKFDVEESATIDELFRSVEEAAISACKERGWKFVEATIKEIRVKK